MKYLELKMKTFNGFVYVSLKPCFRIFSPSSFLHEKEQCPWWIETAWGETLPNSPGQSKNMMGEYLSIQLELLCYCAVSSAKF